MSSEFKVAPAAVASASVSCPNQAAPAAGALQSQLSAEYDRLRRFKHELEVQLTYVAKRLTELETELCNKDEREFP